MSERTTIGGVNYETVGSSTSNLLLKCNGTARIQWGNKLIDLIKNGKLASEDSSIQVSVVSEESEIKTDGIYILDKEKPQLLINKKGKNYNLTGTDLYISTNKQDITGEQKFQVLQNIGMYYNTLDDVNNSGIQNGIVYVIEDNKLYTIQNGTISEFEATIQTVTVENEQQEGEVINSSVKIILNVADLDYLILENQKITITQPIHIQNHAQFGSENADETTGYRLYYDGTEYCLDIDKINVRNPSSNSFVRGMIIMYSGVTEIPVGWAVCDGGTYTYLGVTTTTPNLIGRFIKAAPIGNVANGEAINFHVKEINNEDLIQAEDGSLTNTIKLTKEHLPEHNHPHNAHTHTFNGTISTTDSSNVIQSLSPTTTTYNAVYENDEPLDAITSITSTPKNLSHSHTVTGTINSVTSEEATSTWTNNSINIEPNYYALIFIMKL